MTTHDFDLAFDFDTDDFDTDDFDTDDFKDHDFDDHDFEDYDGDEAPVVEVTVPSLAVLAAADLPERTRIIDRYVREELGRVIGVPPDTVDTTGRTMNSLGVGSVMGLQLQRRMEDALQIEVHLQSLLLANSAKELIDCLAGQLGAEDNPHKRGRAHARPAAGATGVS